MEVAMADDTIPRRKFLLGAGIAGTAVAAGITSNGEAQTPRAGTPAPANDCLRSTPTASMSIATSAISSIRSRSRIFRESAYPGKRLRRT